MWTTRGTRRSAEVCPARWSPWVQEWSGVPTWWSWKAQWSEVPTWSWSGPPSSRGHGELRRRAGPRRRRQRRRPPPPAPRPPREAPYAAHPAGRAGACPIAGGGPAPGRPAAAASARRAVPRMAVRARSSVVVQVRSSAPRCHRPHRPGGISVILPVDHPRPAAAAGLAGCGGAVDHAGRRHRGPSTPRWGGIPTSCVEVCHARARAGRALPVPSGRRGRG